ncbi:uncharacterized protein odam isoform X3 [Centroberyx affinis]|uniref:uncharacterized protein odam isoform X3 n=1 Tax=Centroberyx affinis TaxID=166261 RepID=UPI003A5C1044
MKLQTALVLVCLFRTSFSLPVQIGILASNSNEILRLNGLTLAALGQTQIQASSILPQYVLQQQQPEVLLTPQQEQLGPPQDPNSPIVPQQAQNPMQMVPQYQYPAYAFPQQPRMQAFPYFLPPYGYPQQRNVVLQPNKGQVVQAQQNLERTTQRPQLPLQQASQPKVQTEKTWPLGTQKVPTMPPPDHRGDTSGPGIDEGHPNFPFLFEP